MPKDNHSVMQLYLDGFQNNFYTFFYVDEKKSKKLNNKIILPSHKFLKNKSISKIIYSQKKASENIFLKKNIPFRSFEVKKRDLYLQIHQENNYIILYYQLYTNSVILFKL